MSQARALAEINRFLSSSNPEVLSISGRWGVGKTHAWDSAVEKLGAAAPLSRYAYVSVFGLRSLEALKTSIVQSTVKLGAQRIEPTIDSFYENLSSVDGAKNLLEQGGRKGIGLLGRVLGQVPYAGKFADLLAPGAALLIRRQIVCIDDIERAGVGLDVADILGLVSMLRERKDCKVVLLLNEEGLGDHAPRYREYLEKVVDQAITFEPTPTESAAVAFDPGDALGTRLGERTGSLGITNIRVIRKIRRFLGHLEQELAGRKDAVTDRVIQSIALLGWCVFEPKLAPKLERVRRYNQVAGLFGTDERTSEELTQDAALKDYGFAGFEEVDDVILAGLQSGAFDPAAVAPAVAGLDQRFAKEEVRLGIALPWTLFGDSFEEDPDGFASALIASIEGNAAGMAANEASDVLNMLRVLGRADEADRLLQVYVEAQKDRPREFFAWADRDSFGNIDQGIKEAFRARLAAMPLGRDPGELLLEIAKKDGWAPEDVAFLASVPVADYREILKGLRGTGLHDVIRVALRFGQISGVGGGEREIARRMDAALRLVAAEGPLNAMRVRRYIGDAVPPAEIEGAMDALAMGSSSTEPADGDSREMGTA